MTTQNEIAKRGGEGILTAADIPHLCHSERMIELLMRDGQWHTRDEFERETGSNTFEIMRRARAAMGKLEQEGWQRERKLHTMRPRIFKYRCTPPAEVSA